MASRRRWLAKRPSVLSHKCKTEHLACIPCVLCICGIERIPASKMWRSCKACLHRLSPLAYDTVAVRNSPRLVMISLCVVLLRNNRSKIHGPPVRRYGRAQATRSLDLGTSAVTRCRGARNHLRQDRALQQLWTSERGVCSRRESVVQETTIRRDCGGGVGEREHVEI